MIMHPLDWGSHLRQSLVFQPTPTFMTILLVSAHMHACCHGDEGTTTTMHAGDKRSTITESFLSSIFNFRLWSSHVYVREWIRGLRDPNVAIRTPFSERAAAEEVKARQEQKQEEGVEKKDANFPLADKIISAAMVDPITMLYDTWMYMSEDAERSDSEDSKIDDSDQPTKREGRQKQEEEEETCKTETLPRVSPTTVIWNDVCMLHAVGVCGIWCMMLPSIANPSMLACNSAFPAVKRSAWPIVNSSVLIMGISWTCCCILQFVLGMPTLALCTGMHSVLGIMLAYAAMCTTCPLPPIYMPAVVSSGIGLFIGFLLLCVSHMHTPETRVLFNTESFYMCHAWASCVVLLCMRHTVFRAAVWTLCERA